MRTNRISSHKSFSHIPGCTCIINIVSRKTNTHEYNSDKMMNIQISSEKWKFSSSLNLQQHEGTPSTKLDDATVLLHANHCLSPLFSSTHRNPTETSREQTTRYLFSLSVKLFNLLKVFFYIYIYHQRICSSLLFQNKIINSRNNANLTI